MLSLAESLGMPTEERVKLGGWGDSEATEIARQGFMANRYSEWKLETSLTVKRTLLDVVRLCARERGPLISNASWQDITTLAPSLDLPRDRVRRHLDIPTSAASSLSASKPAPRTTNSSSEDTESIASLDSSSEEGSSDNEEELKGLTFVQADHGKGRLHLLSSIHDTNTSAAVKTKCSRLLIEPYGGSGLECAFERALSTGACWSPRCFAKLPLSQRKWWKRATKTKASSEPESSERPSSSS